MKYNQDFSGIAVADEIINRASSTAAALVHDTILDDSSIEIWTGAGGTGTQLTEGTDFDLADLDATLTAEAGSDIYLSLAIINGTYHSTDLYVSYKTVGDFNEAGDINAITGSVTVSAHYTVGGEQTVNVTAATANITIPAGLAIGTRKTIRKIHATTSSSVNVLRSGSEVFTSASLSTMPIYQNGDQLILEKVTETRWEIVGGGVIIESGSNENGSYIKYSDGTMVQRVEHIKLEYNNSSSLAKDITYPKPFYAEPTITIVLDATAYFTSGDVIAGYQILATAQVNRTSTDGAITVSCAGAGAPFTSAHYTYASCILMGRWRA